VQGLADWVPRSCDKAETKGSRGISPSKQLTGPRRWSVLSSKQAVRDLKPPKLDIVTFHKTFLRIVFKYIFSFIDSVTFHPR
jgi:hypothetical protein